MKSLTRWNKNKFFDQNFTHLEACKYDPGYFLFSCVKKLAEKANVKIRYISRSENHYLYRKTSSYGFWVVGYINENLEHNIKDETFMFDPKQLVCWK